MELKKIMRKSIVARIDIPENTLINEKMISIKRPEGGIEPQYLEKVLGKKTKENIKNDKIIKWDMLK